MKSLTVFILLLTLMACGRFDTNGYYSKRSEPDTGQIVNITK